MIFKTFTIFILCTTFASPGWGKQGFGPGDQEWGYVTVRPRAHMFWWLYRTTAEEANKPLVIWLQGGPGVSGTAYGNFEELGPLDTKLQPRNHTWIKDYNVLFIDNPVGTGFSYAETRFDLCKDNQQIAKDLMVFVKEFLRMFPKFEKTPTFILAESYGGKYTVEFANLWYKEQTKKNVISNFKGVGLIDSLISTYDMYKSMAPYLFNFGMIDSNGYKQLDDAANEFIEAAESNNWPKAMDTSNMIEYLMQKLTYGVDRYTVIKKVSPKYSPILLKSGISESDNSIYTPELKEIMKNVKKVLGLRSDFGVQEPYVMNALWLDMRKPVVDQVEKLLNETDIKVFVFNGQLDLIINTPGTLSWLEKLTWKHSYDWLSAPRLPVVVNNIIEGYSKGYGNLKFYWVNRSGHMIPAHNPIAMVPMLRDLIYNKH